VIFVSGMAATSSAVALGEPGLEPPGLAPRPPAATFRR